MVSSSLSVLEGGEQIETRSPFHTYTEQFYELFPYYLSIGMTYEQYWEQDCELVKYYRKAALIKRDLKNQDAWLQGAYFYEALIDAAPVLHAFAKKGTKPTPYREAPYDLFNRQNKDRKRKMQESQDEKAKAFMEAFAIATNKKFQEKGGEVNA